jgi:hypothetical protein
MKDYFDLKNLILIFKLVKYQKKHNDLSLNLNELKNGSKFKIHNKEYEATISKAKSSFSCLGRKDGSLQAINNFKYIIQVKQVMDIPKPVAPLISINHVEVPDSVNSYLTKKNKKLKRLLKKKNKTK